MLVNEQEFISEAKKIELMLGAPREDINKAAMSRPDTTTATTASGGSGGSVSTKDPSKPIGYQYLTSNSGMFVNFICAS